MVCFSPSRALSAPVLSSSSSSSPLLVLLLYVTGILAAATGGATTSSTSSLDVFESLAQLPRGWTRTGPARPDDPVRLRVSLKQQNLDAFYEGLLQVSTPDHPRYGQHYQGHELRRLLRPAPEATTAALSWLRAHNVTTVRDDGDYLFFQTDAATAGRMLDAQFAWYQYGDATTTTTTREPPLLRTTRYSVPPHVAAHINFVQPTTRFGRTRPLASHVDIMDPGEASAGQSKWVMDATAGSVTEDDFKVNAAGAVNATCATSITPQCLFQLYNINLKGSADGNNSVGYASFVGQSARFSDMAEFSKVYAPFTAARNVSRVELPPSPMLRARVCECQVRC